MADPQVVYSKFSKESEETDIDIEEFYQRYHSEFVDKLRLGGSDVGPTLYVDWRDIHQYDTNLADDFLEHYDVFREVFEMFLEDLDGRHSEDREDGDLRVRVYNLPDGRTYRVGGTRQDRLGDVVAVSGQIAKLTESRMKFDRAVFDCQRCGTETEVPQSDNGFQEPHQCQGCERQGPFKLNPEKSDTYDQRLIQLQEPPEQADGDASTRTVLVTRDLEAWLSDRDLAAGARVTVTGTLTLNHGSESESWGTFDSYLDAEAIEIEDEDYEEINVDEYKEEIHELASRDDIYERLVDSIAPEIGGDQKIRTVKLAVALQLFGGYRRRKPDGSWVRGDSHILLLGDPATGKSSIMDAVEEIAPRVSRASGKGSTAAGLTASAVRDNEFGEGQFTLEAGALALADKGVACIDEIDKMREESLESIHSALEQQRVHVHKGGINATIPTRTALLAAGNPTYGRFDPHEPEYEQHDIDPALFSRFDLPFTLRDRPDEERDGRIADQKTEIWRETAQIDRGELSESDADVSTPDIDKDTLRAYIAYARQNYKPVPTEEALEMIADYYKDIRGDWSEGDSVPITPRVMDALRRLAEASARVRLSENVTVEDVELIKPIVGQALADFGLNEEGEFDADIVETGQSKPQRDRVRSIHSIIKETAREFEDGAPVDEILDRAEEQGIDREKAEYEIEKLKENGKVYQPHSDTLRAISD